jgi:hypothetical protein
MTSDLIPFGSAAYYLMLSLLLFSRGMDFLSTWKVGAVVNLALCFVFALWPLTAIIVITSGLLVAAHNFHSAWLMRSMGEEAYRRWFIDRMARTPLPFYFACLLGETLLTALVGVALVCVSDVEKAPFAIGLGIIMYAFIVLFYTTLSLIRMRRRFAAEALPPPVYREHETFDN